jgi:hypothetical protein
MDPNAIRSGSLAMPAKLSAFRFGDTSSTFALFCAFGGEGRGCDGDEVNGWKRERGNIANKQAKRMPDGISRNDFKSRELAFGCIDDVKESDPSLAADDTKPARRSIKSPRSSLSYVDFFDSKSCRSSCFLQFGRRSLLFFFFVFPGRPAESVGRKHPKTSVVFF